MFETQTDLIELGYASAQQPNTDRIRTWEVAGTSHADAYLVGSAAGALGCTTPINDGPQHVVVQAAFAAFNRWVDNGTPPPSPPPFRLASTKPAALALDSHGNVIGGVRTPAVDVPVSTLSGAAPAGTSVICSLFGSAVAVQLSHLGQPVPRQERLPGRLQGQLGHGHQWRLPPGRRPKLAPRPSRTGAVPFLTDSGSAGSVARGCRAAARCQKAVPLLGDGRVTSKASALARLDARNSSTRPPAARSDAGNPPM